MEQGPLHEVIPRHHECVGIGSLPFLDAQQAVEFILQRKWIVPYWPELPARAPSEMMVSRGRRACLDPKPLWTRDELAGVYALLDQCTERLPLLKGQGAGPLTLSIHAPELGGSLIERLRSASRAILREAEWQYTMLSRVAERYLLVLDEPELHRWPSLTSEERTAVLDQMTYLYVSLREAGIYFGLHPCDFLHEDLLRFPVDLLACKFPGPSANPAAENGVRTAFDSAGPQLAVGVAPATVPAGQEREGLDSTVSRIDMLRSEPTAGPGRRILWSAECGHASSSIDWLETLYRQPLLQREPADRRAPRDS